MIVFIQQILGFSIEWTLPTTPTSNSTFPSATDQPIRIVGIVVVGIEAPPAPPIIFAKKKYPVSDPIPIPRPSKVRGHKKFDLFPNR